MNKDTIIASAHKRLNKYGKHDKRQVALYFDEFLVAIGVALKSGESVKISGFGNFEVKETPARPVRNFKTGELIMMEAKKVIKFKPSETLK